MDRRGFIKLASAVSFSAVGAMSLNSCTSSNSTAETSATSSSSDNANSNKVIVVMPPTSEPAAGFDPLIAWGCGEHMHEPLIQSTLVKTNVNLQFENDLATQYSSSEEGLVWAFDIREDAKFSDGNRLTAHDVAFTLNTASKMPASEVDLTMLDYAEAVTEFQVKIHLLKPFYPILYTLSVLGIVPAHAYGEGYGKSPVAVVDIF